MAIKINGATVIADDQAVTSTSTVSATGTITGGNVATAGTVSATGNATAANLFTAGIVSSAGNIIGSNIIGTITGNVTTTVVSASGNVTGGNILTGGVVSAGGNITGANLAVTANAVITGNLTVNGTTTTVNSNTVTINDKFINVANNASSSAQANGGGLGVGPVGTEYATLEYDQVGNTWDTNIGLSVNGNITGDNLSVGTGTVSVGNIVNTNANGVGNIGSASTRFNQVFALASSAQYADLAEKYTADAEYAPGTVVVFGGTAEVTVDAVDGDRRVAGVVSTNPAYIMNDALESTHVTTVALTGRVPCLVTGTVRKGDLMIAAGLGRARAEENPSVGTVIGKALAEHDGAEGVIEVVVGRF
jgi:hypothetical protein